MTAQERKASAVGRKLAAALWAIESYNGDPEDVMTEALFWIRRSCTSESNNKGPENAIHALQAHYIAGEE